MWISKNQRAEALFNSENVLQYHFALPGEGREGTKSLILNKAGGWKCVAGPFVWRFWSARSGR